MDSFLSMHTGETSIRILIVEDVALLRNRTQSMVQAMGLEVVAACATVKEAIQTISNLHPELLLLDIQLPDGNAFDILDTVQYDANVIFITAYNDHAIKAIKYGALDYLLKPVSLDSLKEAIEKAVKISTQKEQINIARHAYKEEVDRIVLSDQQYIQIVNFKEIVYCYGESGYTTFFLTNGEKIVTSKHLKEYSDILPSQFLRPHKSFLVNERYINKYRKNGYIILKDKTEIPVAERKREEIINQLKRNTLFS